MRIWFVIEEIISRIYWHFQPKYDEDSVARYPYNPEFWKRRNR